MEYKNGDRVEIINYGHQVWRTIEGSDKVAVYDLRPERVGKSATIVRGTLTQNRESYCLDIDDVGEVSWFGLKQLKRIGNGATPDK